MLIPPNYTLVTKESITGLEMVIRHAIESSLFVALDCEFTGLGTDIPNIKHSYPH